MEKRVIKFSLIGAMGVIVLIITAIVGLVIGIPKVTNKAKNKEQATIENKKNEEVDTDTEYKEKVFMKDGTAEEITMKYFKSQSNYKIKYDINNFFINEEIKNYDRFNSLVSDTISIEIMRMNQNYYEAIANIQTELVGADRSKIITYDYNDIVLKDLEGKKRMCSTDEITDLVYIIKVSDTDYFYINFRTRTEFAEKITPIVETMIETFELLE